MRDGLVVGLYLTGWIAAFAIPGGVVFAATRAVGLALHWAVVAGWAASSVVLAILVCIVSWWQQDSPAHRPTARAWLRAVASVWTWIAAISFVSSVAIFCIARVGYAMGLWRWQ